MKYIGTTDTEEALRKRVIQEARERIRVTQNTKSLNSVLRRVTHYANVIEKVAPITTEQSAILQKITNVIEGDLLPKIKGIIGGRTGISELSLDRRMRSRRRRMRY